ncbi:50S ribosomal protein L25 [Victivallis sp. Marseille-Q1083]|uniref:50S ribosomal protein L25 n=1 Tax=Victivallis sp. Marseille-Q1083 TaxID=2717288 RepID=UPI00158D1DF0|nr:50S ribosomal protein L25 [Victivallis sp. Marseille-Q1083]
MSTVHEIAVTARSEFGRNASRRARKKGLVPAIIYSKGKEGRAIFLKENEWEVLSKHDFSVVFLNEGDRKTAAVVKEVQINYMKSYVVHIDFQEVDVHAVIHATLAVHPLGVAAGTNRGGVLDQLMHHIEVSGSAMNMPEKLEVNVSGMQIGDTIAVKDIVLPEGITAVSDPEMAVFHVMAQSAEEEAPAAAAEAEAAPAEDKK